MNRPLRRWRTALALLSLVVALGAQGGEALPLSADPALEARMMQIAEELRCLVCQNETVAASQADLALDLRQQIREQLRQGRSPAEIGDYMVARYGAFVRYRPAFDATTALLWLGPFALLAVAAFAFAGQLKRRRTDATADASAAAFTEAEWARLQALGAAAGHALTSPARGPVESP